MTSQADHHLDTNSPHRHCALQHHSQLICTIQPDWSTSLACRQQHCWRRNSRLQLQQQAAATAAGPQQTDQLLRRRCRQQQQHQGSTTSQVSWTARPNSAHHCCYQLLLNRQPVQSGSRPANQHQHYYQPHNRSGPTTAARPGPPAPHQLLANQQQSIAKRRPIRRAQQPAPGNFPFHRRTTAARLLLFITGRQARQPGCRLPTGYYFFFFFTSRGQAGCSTPAIISQQQAGWPPLSTAAPSSTRPATGSPPALQVNKSSQVRTSQVNNWQPSFILSAPAGVCSSIQHRQHPLALLCFFTLHSGTAHWPTI